jgi:uncharacterized protein YdiU (UPF0061 family)
LVLTLSNSYLTLPKDFYSQQTIKSFRAPQNIIFNQELAQALELNISELEQEGFVIANGDKFPQNAQPISQAYCGHQFGHFVTLGDGRAVLSWRTCDLRDQADLIFTLKALDPQHMLEVEMV